MNLLCEMLNVCENNCFELNHYINENQNEYKNKKFYIRGDSLYYENGEDAKILLYKILSGIYAVKR
jgi:hypothetical protein